MKTKLSFFIFIIISLLFSWLKYNQQKLIYPGMYRVPKILKEPFKKLSNSSYYKKGKTNTLWIILGGNNSLPQDFKLVALNTDHNCLLINYPGFGKTEGNPNPKTTKKIIDDCLKLSGINNTSHINFMCYSIGCAVGLHYIYDCDDNIKNKIKDIKLISPFWAIEEVIYNKYPFPKYLIKKYIDHRWDNYKHIKSIPDHTSVDIIHGKNDKLIDFKQGQRLSKLRDSFKFTLTDDDHDTVIRHVMI